MKIAFLLLLGLGIGLLQADETGPKPGDDLGTLVTTDGTTYTAVKLAKIEPDGISILDSDGGAKIPFEKLSSDLQKKFGYDASKAQSYSQLQQYQQRIAQLTLENAKLRMILSQYQGALSQAQSISSSIEPSQKGYIYFFNYLSNQCKWTSSNHAAAKALSGPFAGMTWGQAQNQSQKLWEEMSVDAKSAYEKKAQMYGSGTDPNTASVESKSSPQVIVTDPFLPPTTTVIDPESGNIQVITH